MDLLLICVFAIISLEMSDELLELSLDISYHILLLKPDEEWASDIFKVEDVLLILGIMSTLINHSLSHHSESLLTNLVVNNLIFLIEFLIH